MEYPAGANVPPFSGGAIGGGAGGPSILPVLLELALEFVLAPLNGRLPSLTRPWMALLASVVDDLSPSSTSLWSSECLLARFAGWPPATESTPGAPTSAIGAES